MKPSSISSSEEVRLKPDTTGVIQFRPRIVSVTFAAIVVMLAAIEGVLRVPAVADRLPLPTHFNEPDVAMRVRTLEALKGHEHRDRVDILFVGSSIVRCNIRPNLFDEAISRQAHASIVSFNAGLSGLWPGGVELYTEHLWLPHARPRIVLQGIRYGEVAAPPQTRRYETIVTGTVESAWATGGVSGRIKAAAFEHVRLLQYRGIWIDWLKQYLNGRGEAAVPDELRVFTDDRGWTPRLPTLDVVRARNLLAAERPYTAVPEQTPRLDALDAIRQTSRAVQRSGAEYALVNVPEHSFRWSGLDGLLRYHDYIAALQGLADEEGFAFIDVTAGAADQFSRDAEYSDYHHMSPEGAGRFTVMLAAAIAGAAQAEPAGSGATTRNVALMPEQMALGLHRAAAMDRK
jgi:hypothetical protein